MCALMFDVITLKEAIAEVKKRLDYLDVGTENVPLALLSGRICAKDIYAPENLPSFLRSTVDGFAVKASETYGASESVPALFNVVGKGEMGVEPSVKLNCGEAYAVPTGGMLPQGADCAAMFEYTDTGAADELFLYRPQRVAENTVAAGEDVCKGEIIMSAGEIISPLKCGVLAALGITSAEVYKKINLTVLSTGDELVAPDSEIYGAKIRDVNSTLISTLLADVCSTVRTAVLPDDENAIRAALQDGIAAGGITVISGGSSVGERDYTYKLLSELCDEVYIKGISIKPGKPTMAARSGNALVFGLAGHVMAAAVTAKLLIADTVKQSLGVRERFRRVTATAKCNFPSASGRSTIIPVALAPVGNGWEAYPLFSKSGLISVIAKADGYIVTEDKTEGIYQGQNVEVTLL